jgi:hypothetical protein
MLASGEAIENKQKMVQMQTLFTFMSAGLPMTVYPKAQPLYVKLEVPDQPRAHWCRTSGWKLAEALSSVIDGKTHKLVSTRETAQLAKRRCF